MWTKNFGLQEIIVHVLSREDKVKISKRSDGIICYYVRWRGSTRIRYVRATKLQQALATDKIYIIYENMYRVYVALFKSVISVKGIHKSSRRIGFGLRI